MAHAVAQEVIVELNDEVRACPVELHCDVIAIALARHGGVRQIGHRAQVALPNIRRGRVLERIVRVLEELLALEVEPQRFAHRVRRHVVAVPPRVRADQLHANVFALHALRPVRRHARAELHPLARTLRLADAHEVVVPARRRLVDVVRAVGDGGDGLGPAVAKTDFLIKRIIFYKIIRSINIGNKEIFYIAYSPIQRHPSCRNEIRGCKVIRRNFIRLKSQCLIRRNNLIQIPPPPYHTWIKNTYGQRGS